MKTETRSQILKYIEAEKQVTPQQLVKHLRLSNVAIHRQLKLLLQDKSIIKIGKPPRVWYVPFKNVAYAGTASNLPDKAAKLIEEQYLYLNPDGVVIPGVLGFFQWAVKTRQGARAPALASEYETVRQTANQWYKGKNWIEATSKISDTFPKKVIDEVFYADFYSLPKFGKTKLGLLTLYAKLSESRPLINQIAETVKPIVLQIIHEYKIDAVAYIPHSLPRKIPFLKVLREEFGLTLPEITLTKAYPGEIRLPQKSLTKLEERVENARKTIFIHETQMPYERILLIDDAVGSGATFQETALKLKEDYRALFVAGFAVVGSYKGFEVIKEI